MLRILYGTDWQHNADRVLDELCGAAAAGERGQILIVPEQFSFDAEWRLCERGGDRIALSAEVLSFTRLYDRLCARCGGAAEQIMDKRGRLIAMAGALEQVRSRLKIYGAQVTKPEFLLQLLALYEELCSCGVERDGLAAAGASLGGLLAEKLEEFRLIFESYEAVCRGAAQDPSTRLTRLAELLQEHDFACGRRVWIDGFSDFTAQERGVIAALLSAGAELTVSLCCDDLRSGQDVFAVPRETAAQLRRAAELCGEKTLTLHAQPPRTGTAAEHLREHLFDARTPVWQAAAPVTLTEEASPGGEALAALAGIQSLLRSGARQREIAVACTQSEVYRPILERLFAQYGISGYFAGTTPILQTPVVRMTLAALRAAAGRMDAADVMEYLKSGAAPIDRDDCDLLENYAKLWQLRGTAWEKAFTRSVTGFRNRKNEAREAELLRRLNAARQTALEPLCALRHALAAAENTGGQILALHDFFETIRLAERLQQRTEALEAAGQYQRAQLTGQLYEALLGTMEQIYAVLGASVRSPEEFYRFFRAALSQCSVGTVPATLDSVRVGSLRDLRNSRAKHLFVLGASNGLLPARAEKKSLLTQTERRALKLAGVTVAPDESEQLSRDLLCACTVLCSAAGSLFLSCRTDQQSYLYSRVEALFPRRDPLPTEPLPAGTLQAAAELAACGQDAGDDAALASQLAALRQRADYRLRPLPPDAVRSLYGGTLYLSASKLDTAATCRLRFFLQYGLRAEALREARIDRQTYGSFLHDVLEKTARQVVAEGGFHAVTLERTLAIAAEHMRRYAETELRGLQELPEREKSVFFRRRDEIRAIVENLWEELRQSAFVPKGFELGFSGELALRIRGSRGSAALTGSIDRVDLYTARDGQVYARVIDYKSGVKTFDYTDVLEGLNQQMLLYLLALQQHGAELLRTQVQSAGVLYVPTRLPLLSEKTACTPEQLEKKRMDGFRRKGLLLDDPEILQAMEPSDSPVYLPYKVKKGVREGFLADRGRLELLERYVLHTAERMTDEILSGAIAPGSYERGEKSPCDYCEYRAVCHTASGAVPIRELAATKADEFWQRLERKERGNGGD